MAFAAAETVSGSPSWGTSSTSPSTSSNLLRLSFQHNHSGMTERNDGAGALAVRLILCWLSACSSNGKKRDGSEI